MSERVNPTLIVDRQIAFSMVHGVVAMVIRPEQWSVGFAERLYEESTALTSANPPTVVRVVGAGPSAIVRRRLADLQAELDQKWPYAGERRVAVMSGSAVVRAAVTALAWLTGDPMRAFALDNTTGATRWILPDESQSLQLLEDYRMCLSLLDLE